MSTAQTGMEGAPPVVTITPVNPEASKYTRVWESPEYRKLAPGEHLAPLFLATAKPPAGSHVIDFGCGTGRGAMMIAMLGGCRVTMLDFARNCLDPEVAQACTTQPGVFQFIKHDLETPLRLYARYGYCTDVMEHIPPDKVRPVLRHILDSAQHVFFAIATQPDRMGQPLIGEPLHLTVQSAQWWLAELAEMGAVVLASDSDAERVWLYVTSWMTGRQVAEGGRLNIAEEALRANVEHNLQQGWAQVVPHPTNNEECMILGGGPTLSQFTDEIHAKRAAGVKLITLNGAYNWALEHGLTPSATMVADARPFNARFTHPVVDGCKYFIGSHCDPSVLAGLPPARTLLWHMNPELVRDLLTKYLPEGSFCIPGGSTVLLRAIPLLRMLGFRRFHLYGCDSCLMGEELAHHAFPQPENNGGIVIPVVVNSSVASDRVFHCAPWMVSQAEEFLEIVRRMGETFELEIHGDGLLAYLLDTAATLDVGDAVQITPKEG